MSTYGYIRVSTAEQVEGTSMDEQLRQIAGNALAHNLDIDRWVEDGGVSGADPFFERLARHGVQLMRGDTIVVAKLDRFSRDARDALNTIHELKEIGVRLIINGHGDVTDDSNLTARLMLEVMAVFAGHERRTIKARQKDGQAAKRAKGGHLGGHAPFGFKIVGKGRSARLEPIPELQDAIEDMHKLRAEGYSLRRISDHVLAAYGERVSHEAVRRITSEEAPCS